VVGGGLTRAGTRPGYAWGKSWQSSSGVQQIVVRRPPMLGVDTAIGSESGSASESNKEDGHHMAKVEKDETREHRIWMEAIVDAYGPEEQAMGWYYYLDDRIQFPFEARCIAARRISPLKEGEQVTVIQMAPEDECMREMFVEIQWADRTFGVPLAQLQPLGVDEETEEAIADWCYWVARGYEF